MKDKSTREVVSSEDNSDTDEQFWRKRLVRGSSSTAREGNLIDLSNDVTRNTKDSMQENLEGSSPDEIAGGNDKPSIASHVFGLLPFGRGSSQRPRGTNSDQQANAHAKLEEDFKAVQKRCEALGKERRDISIENKELISKLKSAQEQHERIRGLAAQEAERHKYRIKSAKSRNESLEKSWQSAEDQITCLQLEADAADEKFRSAEMSALEEISRLTSDVERANDELFQMKSSAHKEIVKLQSQIKILNEKNDKFRQMLIPVSEKQVLDAEVVQSFTKLRSSMMGLVRRTWKLKLRHDFDVRTFTNGQYHFFESGEVGSYDRLRHLVFCFIYQGIFSAPNYFLKDDLEHFEEHLQQVESVLFQLTPVENRKLLMDWRNASFKVTETCRGNGNQLSGQIQSRIWDFLSPLELVDSAAEVPGRKKLEAICDAAIDLSLTIRQLKDHFWIDDMQNAVGQPVSEWGQFTEEMASVPLRDGKQPGTIAYVIAGALTKRPKEDLEKVLVLEKAEVAVYCQETEQRT